MGSNPAAPTMQSELSEDRIRELIERVERGFNDRDERIIESVLSPHLVDHSAALGGVDLRQRLARVLSALPDATYRVEGHLVQGNAVAWRWAIRGTHSRDIMGYDATGRAVELTGLSMAVFEHGKAVEHWEFPDYTAFVRQLEGDSG